MDEDRERWEFNLVSVCFYLVFEMDMSSEEQIGQIPVLSASLLVQLQEAQRRWKQGHLRAFAKID